MSDSAGSRLPFHTVDAQSVLWNVPPEEREGKPLLVMMHGLGSHEGDLFGLNRFMPPGMAVASLRAPMEYGDGFAWFDSSVRESDAAVVDASVKGVLAWLDGLETKPDNVGLMGFSQGGCMALQLIRESPERFDYVLQLSGFISPTPHTGDASLRERVPRMPVFWAHGDYDEVIPTELIDDTGVWLSAHTAVEAHRYPMAHTVSQEELADIVDFVTRQLNN